CSKGWPGPARTGARPCRRATAKRRPRTTPRIGCVRRARRRNRDPRWSSSARLRLRRRRPSDRAPRCRAAPRPPARAKPCRRSCRAASCGAAWPWRSWRGSSSCCCRSWGCGSAKGGARGSGRSRPRRPRPRSLRRQHRSIRPRPSSRTPRRRRPRSPRRPRFPRQPRLPPSPPLPRRARRAVARRPSSPRARFTRRARARRATTTSRASRHQATSASSSRSSERPGSLRAAAARPAARACGESPRNLAAGAADGGDGALDRRALVALALAACSRPLAADASASAVHVASGAGSVEAGLSGAPHAAAPADDERAVTLSPVVLGDYPPPEMDLAPGELPSPAFPAGTVYVGRDHGAALPVTEWTLAPRAPRREVKLPLPDRGVHVRLLRAGEALHAVAWSFEGDAAYVRLTADLRVLSTRRLGTVSATGPMAL